MTPPKCFKITEHLYISYINSPPKFQVNPSIFQNLDPNPKLQPLRKYKSNSPQISTTKRQTTKSNSSKGSLWGLILPRTPSLTITLPKFGPWAGSRAHKKRFFISAFFMRAILAKIAANTKNPNASCTLYKKTQKLLPKFKNTSHQAKNYIIFKPFWFSTYQFSSAGK